MTKIKIHPSSVLLLLLPCFGVLSWLETALLWGCAALHELGHVIAYRICGCGMESITVLPFGICAIPKDAMKVPPREEVFCAAAGPAVNLLLSALMLALPASETTAYLLYCNATLLIGNLFPVLPLDGGRMVYYALARSRDAITCETVCLRCAVIVLSLLLYPACAELITGKNPSFLLIWVYLAIFTALRRGSI